MNRVRIHQHSSLVLGVSTRASGELLVLQVLPGGPGEGLCVVVVHPFSVNASRSPGDGIRTLRTSSNTKPRLRSDSGVRAQKVGRVHMLVQVLLTGGFVSLA